MDNIATIIGTLATVLFSAGAWQFYEKRMKMKSEENKADRSEQNMYRDDLKQRVKRLEQLLEASAGEKDAMRAQILALTQEVSELRVKVTFLEEENDRLKKA
jgi:hypothetical protein